MKINEKNSHTTMDVGVSNHLKSVCESLLFFLGLLFSFCTTTGIRASFIRSVKGFSAMAGISTSTKFDVIRFDGT